VTSRLGSLFLPIGSVAYVSFAAAQAQGGFWPWVVLAVSALALGEVHRQTRGSGAGAHASPNRQRALFALAFGTSLWVAARSGPSGRATFDAVANLGCGVAAVSGLWLLARIPPSGGLFVAKPSVRSLDAAAFAALLWSLALVLPAAKALFGDAVRIDPLAIDYATTTASVASLLLYVAASLRLRLLRRLEVGVGERASGAVTLTLTVLAVAIPSALFDLGPPDRVLPVAVHVAAVAAAFCAATADPARVSSLLRGTMAVTVLGAPLTLVAGVLVRTYPLSGGTVLLIALPLAIGIGLVGRAVARPLGPEQSRWLLAIEDAGRAALEPEPDAALRAVLLALSKATGVPGARPELYRVAPHEVLAVDLAGNLQVERTRAPEQLYELALCEPERTLTADVLEASSVRVPAARSLASWFSARRTFSTTVIVDEEGPGGCIALPRGNRQTPMTLEESRALRMLADRISALLAVSSALARSRERELAAKAQATREADARERLKHALESRGARNRLAAEHSATPVLQAAYSPAVRMAVERLSELAKLGANLYLVMPPGSLEAAWVAASHAACPRAEGPLVHIDGSESRFQAPEAWATAASPFMLADGGTLAISNVTSLPLALQDRLASLLSHQSEMAPQPGTFPRLGLVVTSTETPLSALESGKLAAKLYRWVEREVVVPPLRERAEDLRPLVLARLGSLGLALRGEPLGIDPAALQLVLEHSFPANEAELDALLLKAALLASGPRLTQDDLILAGIRAPDLDTPPRATSANTLPPVVRRRVARHH
jgi:hypothetical protein